ncbi:hypothetical protein ECG_01253 [Echinococcus granulosus]|uniref:Transmembrane protein 231 n=1 Tax=Echinococcus granulosus TaxID=6210 RepID=A0A068WE03_ECHGR|nr:hypothetical protein ECG_01253 [Echinococcus granulosus]CDS15841.1 hypothetical protein EgrG_000824800 [Echinococcus granulosus]
MNLTLGIIAVIYRSLSLIFVLNFVMTFCYSQMGYSIQRSPFDINIKQITDTHTQASAMNIAKVELPENTRFLWYYSPTKDPIAWMLEGVGESLVFNHSKAEGNGLLNLTVIYPNGVRESIARSLWEHEELEVNAFANEVLLDRGLRDYKVALSEGDNFVFKCVFRGSLTNLKIILPDAMECKDQFLDANAESISVCCTNLRFRKGQYGCEGQSEERRLLSTVYLYGNAASPLIKYTWIQMTLIPLAVLTWHII